MLHCSCNMAINLAIRSMNCTTSINVDFTLGTTPPIYKIPPPDHNYNYTPHCTFPETILSLRDTCFNFPSKSALVVQLLFSLGSRASDLFSRQPTIPSTAGDSVPLALQLAKCHFLFLCCCPFDSPLLEK